VTMRTRPSSETVQYLYRVIFLLLCFGLSLKRDNPVCGARCRCEGFPRSGGPPPRADQLETDLFPHV
jgi:hypothetical protein